METSYKKHFNRSYMILQGENSPGESYELAVLAHNQISGLLKMETQVADGNICFWYDITGWQKLSDYLERRQADSQLLQVLFGGMEQMLEKVSDYLLQEESILLHMEYIYLDFARENIAFVYLPGWIQDSREAFQKLMESLLPQVNHSDKQATAMVYAMYQMSLEREESFCVMLKKTLCAGQEKDSGEIPEEESHPWKACNGEDVSCQQPKLWDEEHVNHQSKTVDKEEGYSSNPWKKEEGLLPKSWKKEENSPRKPWKEEDSSLKFWEKPKRSLERLKEKIGFSERKQEQELYYVTQEEEVISYPTEVLNSGNGVQGILLYQGMGELSSIRIDKPCFIIGKKAEEVDGYMDGTGVSRVHARIRQEDGAYFIEDLNSTNGTYINGEPLEYQQKVKLEVRDRITFGMEEYVFM